MPQSNNSYEVKNVATASSGSSEGCSKNSTDDKKRRRMESNRESARRSRQKKQEHLDNLIKQVGGLTKENEEIGKKIGDVSGVFNEIDSQNKVLRIHKDRLAARLESLESIIEIARVVKGSSSSSTTTTTTIGNNNNNNNYNGECLYEVSNDPLMKPWQLPCPSMPIMASSGVHRFKF